MRKNPFFHTVVLVGLGVTGGCGDSEEGSHDASATDGQALADRILADATQGKDDASQVSDAAGPDGKDASLGDAAQGKDASGPDLDARIKKDAMVAIL